MRHLSSILFFLLLANVVLAGGTTGSDQAHVYGPTGFHFPVYRYVQSMMSTYTALGYQIVYTDLELIKAEQGTILGDYAELVLGSELGIYAHTAEHGYEHPNWLLVAGYENEADCQADVDSLNTARGYPGAYWMRYVSEIEHDQEFYALMMGAPTCNLAFSDYGTLVAFDSCKSLGMMSNGFAGRSAGVGYSDEVGYVQSWLDADAFWTDMARLKTVTEALESAGTLTFSGADTDFKLSKYRDAMFDGASAVNGHLSFDAFPVDTERFILKAADNPAGPFEEFASVYPKAGQQHYEYEFPPNMTWGQVCEVETDGDFLIHTHVRDRKEVTPLELSPIPSFEELSGWCAAHGASIKNSATTQWGENKVLLTITITEWKDYVWDNVNLYWKNQHGYETYIETFNHDPAREPQEHDDLQSYLRDTIIKDYYNYAQAAGKTLVVHLIGGKNDWVMWSDLQSWPPEWQDRYDDYIANGYPTGGYPHRDFIPGWYSPRTGSPGNNSGGWVPWVSSDEPYQHMDDDGIPDIVVTRWSVTTPDEILSRAQSMQNHNNNGFVAPAPYYEVGVWVGELYHDNAGDTERVMHSLNNLIEQLPSDPCLVMESTTPDPGERNEVLIDELNQGKDLVVMLANTSNPLHPAKQMWVVGANPNFSFSALTPNGRTPYSIAVNCGSVGAGRTLHPWHPRTVCQQNGRIPDVGFIGMLGCESTAIPYAVELITLQAVNDLYEGTSNGLSIADCMLLTQQRIIAEHDDSDAIMETLASLRFEGDPCSCFLMPVSEMSPVQDEVPSFSILEQNHPNPFNPVTDISFYVPKDEKVTLEVFDLAGRKVRSLINEHLDSGQHKVSWRGDDQNGQKVASGIYMYRLNTGTTSESRKMMLLK